MISATLLHSIAHCFSAEFQKMYFRKDDHQWKMNTLHTNLERVCNRVCVGVHACASECECMRVRIKERESHEKWSNKSLQKMLWIKALFIVLENFEQLLRAKHKIFECCEKLNKFRNEEERKRVLLFCSAQVFQFEKLILLKLKRRQRLKTASQARNSTLPKEGGEAE